MILLKIASYCVAAIACAVLVFSATRRSTVPVLVDGAVLRVRDGLSALKAASNLLGVPVEALVLRTRRSLRGHAGAALFPGQARCSAAAAARGPLPPARCLQGQRARVGSVARRRQHSRGALGEQKQLRRPLRVPLGAGTPRGLSHALRRRGALAPMDGAARTERGSRRGWPPHGSAARRYGGGVRATAAPLAAAQPQHPTERNALLAARRVQRGADAAARARAPRPRMASTSGRPPIWCSPFDGYSNSNSKPSRHSGHCALWHFAMHLL